MLLLGSQAFDTSDQFCKLGKYSTCLVLIALGRAGYDWGSDEQHKALLGELNQPCSLDATGFSIAGLPRAFHILEGIHIWARRAAILSRGQLYTWPRKCFISSRQLSPEINFGGFHFCIPAYFMKIPVGNFVIVMMGPGLVSPSYPQDCWRWRRVSKCSQGSHFYLSF